MAVFNECCVLVVPASFDKDDQCLRTELEAAVERGVDYPVDRPLSSAVL